MLNLVTGPEGTAGAVLVRALEPLDGVETMSARRHGRTGTELTSGPGKVAEALGVEMRHNGIPLGGDITVYDAPGLLEGAVETSGRIGLSAGHEMPLRFFVADNGYVSRGRPGPRTRRRPATTDRETT
jgi:DNA-3-methyladenine glycosylase